MSEMIQRVADAVANASATNERDFELIARAAIEAIEPTEEMERAFKAQGYKRMNFKLQFKAALVEALK